MVPFTSYRMIPLSTPGQLTAVPNEPPRRNRRSARWQPNVAPRFMLSYTSRHDFILIAANVLLFLLFAHNAPACAQHFVTPMFDVNVTRNIQYGSSLTGTGVNVARHLDLYQPAGSELPAELPAIVLMHGGSFVEGDKSSTTMTTYANQFASRGYVAVSINYRLLFDDFFPDPPGAPITVVPSRFPSWLPAQLDSWGATTEDYLAEIAAAISDQAMAVNWLVDNASTYGIDPRRIAAGGYSAGAISSLSLGVGAVDGVEADVGAVFSQAGGLFGLEPFVHAGDPGVFILHGDGDTTVPFAEVGFLQAALMDANVPFESLIVEGTDHSSSPLRSALLSDPDPFFEFMIQQLDAHAIVPGDFNDDKALTVDDVDLLIGTIISRSNTRLFDLNGDELVDNRDLNVWITERKITYFGDANLDGEFNSGDLVAVFGAGEYEDTVVGNSGWAEGDWDGDGDFTSGDLVVAFADGGYEQGPRMAANAVPEPASMLILTVGLIGIAFCHRRSRS